MDIDDRQRRQPEEAFTFNYTIASVIHLMRSHFALRRFTFHDASSCKSPTRKCASNLETSFIRQPLPNSSKVRASHYAKSVLSVLTLSFRMPIYDDAQEKAARLLSRHALHDLQLNQIRAAASPMRKLNSFNRAGSNSPQSASGARSNRARATEEDGLLPLGTSTASPVKRVPILANFEEWMKMATDNVRPLSNQDMRY